MDISDHCKSHFILETNPLFMHFTIIYADFVFLLFCYNVTTAYNKCHSYENIIGVIMENRF